MNESIENEYYDLLLRRCISPNGSLFIFCNKVCLKYVRKIEEKARMMGFSDIHLEIQDSDKIIEKLNSISLEEIASDPFFACEKWNEYAKKGASFLILKTEMPGYMSSVPGEKIVEMNRTQRFNQRPYKELQLSYRISWCIAILPNECWGRKLFPQSERPEEELFDKIVSMCMVNGDGTSVSKWNSLIVKNTERVEKLNSLGIKELHYQSAKGTDFRIGLSRRALWEGTSKEGMIVNMPSFEIFTIPDCNRIDGDVYSTKPLSFNGALVEGFHLTFRNGRIVNVEASKGEDVLKNLVKSTKGSDTLGEVALVDADSPISRTNINFGNTLFDENASCHLAIGNAFPHNLSGYDDLDQEGLKKEGFNKCDLHVDFMIGDDTLNITAVTYDGEETQIMKNGRIVL